VKRTGRKLFAVLFVGLCLAVAGWVHAEEPKLTFVVPTHPRLAFRKDDLAELRERCLTTHAKEYALLKADADAAAALETKPVSPGLLFQLTGESRYLPWAESDYDAFHEALDPAKAGALARNILYSHRRQMSPTGAAYLGEGLSHYMHLLGGHTGVLTIVGDDVPQARPGELQGRLQALARVFDESRQVYDLISYRRGGKATSFHCACFIESGPKLFEKWRVATGENYFGSALLAGLILQTMHNTLPLDHSCAAMTNSWGHDHVGRPADYIVASRSHDGLCQWVIHNPAWATVRDVGQPDPNDFNALGHAWVNAVKDLGGYKEASWTVPVGWWVGHMPERILYYEPALSEVPPSSLPTAALFEGLGIVCTRSAWTDDAVFARLHSGPNFRGEPPHLNDNTFVLYHKGWLVKPERSKNVLTSFANSVLVKDPDEKIMIAGGIGGLWPDAVWNGKAGDIKPSKENDGGQSYWREDIGKMNIKCRGKITAYEATDLYTYAVGDATESYNPAKLESFTRQFLHIKPGLVIIFDRVKSKKPEFEKRWVLHTKGRAEETDEKGVFKADAVSAAGWSARGYERVPGFEVPKMDEGPPRTFTLKFRTEWDGMDVGLAYKTGPDCAKLTWSLDGGNQKGAIDQHADEEKTGINTVLATNIPKGSHTLVLEETDGKLNFSHFTVRMGGRLFVRTLLPEAFTREVTPNAQAKADAFNRRADWRTDVIPARPRTDDVFLHVLEATDRSQERALPVRRIDVGTRIVLRFEYQGKNYEVAFNRTGKLGGRVKIRQGWWKSLLDREFPAGIVDTDDAHIERCRTLMRQDPEYDYDVSEIVLLSPRADSAKLIEALGDRRWYARFYAVRALAAKREKSVSGKLAALLADGDARVAGIAAEALGRLGARQHAAQLVKALSSDADEVRFYAAWALGELKAREAVDPLVKLLADSNDFVSGSAAEALGKLGDERAADALARAIDAREPRHMKTAYLSALTAIGGEVAGKRLEAFRNSDDSALRACALSGLVKLAGADAAPILRTALSDEDGLVRTWAQRRLFQLGDESSLAELIATAKNAEAAFAARRAAITTLGELRYKPAADLFATLLEDQKAYPYPHRTDSISAHAALALYRLGDPRGADFLKGAILNGAEKDKIHVAKAAAKVLSSLDKETAVPILISGLDVRRSQAIAETTRSLFLVTGEDPGADIDIVGWRRVGRDAEAWKKWWEENEARYAE